MTPLRLDGCVTLGTREKWAMLSPCGAYRYALGRSWGPDDSDDHARPTFAIFMLNPSTADHEDDDQTIRKCVHFAKQEGCSSLLVRNLFAWRATDPAALKRVSDPYGRHNADALRLGPTFGQRVAAWGALGPAWLRSIAKSSQGIIQTTPGLCVLHLTQAGEPGHPLFLRNTTRARLWVDVERERRATPAKGHPR